MKLVTYKSCVVRLDCPAVFYASSSINSLVAEEAVHYSATHSKAYATAML